MTPSRTRLEVMEVLPLGLGVLALAAGTAFGWDASLLTLLASPPLVVRIAFTLAALIAAFLLLGAAVARMEGRAGSGGHLVSLLRGVRLAFLALARGVFVLGLNRLTWHDYEDRAAQRAGQPA